ncbi:MAG: hypothetical protein GC155_16895 [Alphaproteobacteria bacterium]|nr:hypothetical protein [Alphaproteobacteria bacterium]
MRVTVLFLALVCLAAPTAHAQRGNRAGVCAPTNAEHATLAEIAADRDGWLGRCVTVAGVYSNERVYADADAIYGKSDASIGGYVDGQGSLDGYWAGDFTGRIADCAKAAADIDAGLLRSPGILVDGGSRQAGCKEPKGQFLLFMSQGELEPAGLVRQFAPKTGSLAPAPADWSARDEVEALAIKFASAMLGKSRPVLKEVLGDDYAVEQVMTDADNGIAILSTRADTPPHVTLLEAGGDADAFNAAVCWRRRMTGAPMWPIAMADADNRLDRPYACLRLYKDASGPVVADAARAFNGLIEPTK